MDEFDVIAWRMLTDGIETAKPGSRVFWDAIQRAIAYKNHLEEAGMAKGKAIETEGMSMVWGGGGTVRSNGGVGHRGQRKTLTAGEAKRLMRKQIAHEKQLKRAARAARKTGKK